MDDIQIRNLIKSWRERARSESDFVSKFVFLWFCFNAALAHESREDVDRAMIDWLKASPPSRLVKAYEAALRSDVFTRDLRTLAGYSPIVDPRGKRSPVVISNELDFPNIVEAIYRVRCHLFHGQKSAGDLRDQKLIKVSAALLEKWIGNMMSAWS